MLSAVAFSVAVAAFVAGFCYFVHTSNQAGIRHGDLKDPEQLKAFREGERSLPAGYQSTAEARLSASW